jgi:hypothetical protein
MTQQRVNQGFPSQLRREAERKQLDGDAVAGAPGKCPECVRQRGVGCAVHPNGERELFGHVVAGHD